MRTIWNRQLLKLMLLQNIQKSFDEFMLDIKTIDATMLNLQQMIEKIKYLSLEFKKKYNYIPWNDIIGFRNRIVHDYGKK